MVFKYGDEDGLASTIIEVELSLGNATDASRLAARALEAAGRTAPDDSRRRRLLLLYGRALTDTGDIVGALPVMDEVRQLDGVERPDWMVAYGRLLMRHARFAESAAIFERAIDGLGTRGPDDDLATQAHWELARAMRYLDRFDEALQANERTLQWQRAVLGDNHPRVATTRFHRVATLWAAGLGEEAVDEGRQVDEEFTRIYGEGSLMAARSSSLLAQALNSIGKHELAIELYRDALRIWRDKLGVDHSQHIRGTYNLADMLTEIDGAENEAFTLFREAVTAAEQRFGLRSDTTHFMRIGYAKYLLKGGRSHDALELLTTDAARAGLHGLLVDNRADYLELLGRAAQSNGCDNASGAVPCRIAAEFVRRAVPE